MDNQNLIGQAPGLNRFDDCLSIKEGHLFIEDCDTVELVHQFGSPIFVLSEEQIRQNTRRFNKAFSEHWTEGPVDILPALKANTNLATRFILSQEGAGADIYSEGELHAALAAGVNRERISVNGGGKSEPMIRKCVEEGVRITIEDLDEPALIEKVAAEMGKVAKVRLRVKPNFPNLWKKTDFSQEYASVDLGIQVYKAGIPAQFLPELGKSILAMKHVKLLGFHMHAGRHLASLWYWQGLIREYGRLIGELCHFWEGYQPEEIDIGGGFPVPRDPFNKLGFKEDVVLSWITWPGQILLNILNDRTRYKLLSKMIQIGFVKEPNTKPVPSIQAYAKTTVNTLKEELNKAGVSTAGVRLQLEPGRSLYGNAGIHLTTIKKVKRQTSPIVMNWVLTDTTIFFLIGGAYEYNLHDFRIANKANNEAVEIADIVGHSCFADRILPFVRVPKLESGDIIAILDTGAYQESSASNFNALPRPGTVLVNGDESEIIKRPETIEDVFNRDRVPNRLIVNKQESLSPISKEKKLA